MRYVNRIPTLVMLALITLISFTAVGFAAETVSPADSTSLLDLFKPVFNAFSGGHYAYAGALLVILLVALVKRYASGTSWVHSDAGGTGLALLLASATASAAALAAPGATFSAGLLKSALLVGVGAAGGFAVLKALVIEPLLKPLEAKAPAWMKPAFAVVFWIFDKPDAVKQAEAAGNAALAKAPSAGVSATTGAPTDVK